MTVIYKGEVPEGREAENNLGVRTYTRVFEFETTEQTEDAWDVGSHPNAPVIGQSFRDAWCRSSKPKCVKGWKVWQITAFYSSEYELAENPLNDPARVRVSTEQFQKEAMIDNAGNSICNSLGDPYDPPLMMDDSRRVIHVTKNLATYPEWIMDYQDAVNSDSFSVKGITYAAGKGKMQRVSISDEFKRNSISYYVCEFEIHLEKDGWLLSHLDEGFRELSGAGTGGSGSGSGTGDVINILNPGDNERPSAPVPMNGAGSSLATPGSAVNVINTHAVYYTLPFSVLPFT